MSFTFPLILDGGFATQLEESFQKDLTGALWSAKCLEDDPNAIKQVHRLYYEAGAQVATTCSYQASIQGFLNEGYSNQHAIQLMRKSVQLAREARDEFTAAHPNSQPRYVALSAGCYGAVLANGAEYTGQYGLVTKQDLVDFHNHRLDIFLQEPGIDMILFETIPSIIEAEAIRTIVDSRTDLPPVGVGFSCKSDNQISDGTLLSTCLDQLDTLNVFAAGINCTKPRFIPSLLSICSLYARKTGKAILLYPDGGAEWDAVGRCWHSEKVTPETFGKQMAEYTKQYGPKMVVGGCCGTSPAYIRSYLHFLSQ
ncbi:Homocysteine S-methyltransferase [Phycomyces nitens]|nr:Homocysteine S-methyltransferase [Phycomyces nitens]